MTESMRPPILKPDINVPVTLTVPFGDYKELEGQYGTQFMYNVQVDGETQTLFADVKLHQAMLTAGLAPGVTMTITKTQESFETAAGEQRRANVWLISGGSGTPTAATALAVPAAPAPTPTPPAGNAREVWVAQVHHFKRCIAQAEKAYTDLGYTVDKSSPDSINSAAATLFIQSSKTLDIAALSSPPEPPPAPAPAPTPPPTPPTPVLQGGGAGGAADYNDDLPFAPAF